MRKVRLGVCSVLLSSIIFYVGCSKQEGMIVAKVGNEKITWGEFKEGYLKSPQYRRAQDDSAAKREYLDAIIQQKLIIQEAYKRGLDKKEDVLSQIEQTEKGLILQSLYMKEIVENVVNEAEVQTFYDHSDKEVQASHILIKAPPAASPPERQKARAKIDSLLVLVKEKGDNFGTVAMKHSEDPTSARNMGDLGFVSWGTWDDAFQRVAFNLKPGEISDVVETRFGYHIIKVEAQREAQRKSYEEMEDQIRNKLMGQKKNELRQKADEYIENLKKEKNLTIDQQAVTLLSEKKKESDFNAENLTDDEKSTILARYDGGEFTISDYVEWEKEIPPKAQARATDAESLKRHIEGKLVNDFLVARAKVLKLGNEPNIKKRILDQKEQLMAKQFNKSIEEKVEITDENVLAHFEEHKDEFVSPEKVNIQEILVTEKTVAENLLKRMKGGADIAALAKQHSERKWAAERGGEFGLFTENQYGPIGKEAFALKVGQFGGPLKVSSGYSIFKVTDKQTSRSKTFEEVKATIRRDLETEKKKAAFEDVMSSLKEKTEVDINLEILTMSVQAETPSGDDRS